MRKGMILLSGLLLLISCSSREESSRVEERIQNVENGLVEMSTLSLTEQFQAERIAKAKKVTLSERMKHYNVPGVSIALINDYSIEWTKGYGLLRAGGSIAVTPETCFEAASTTKLLTASIALYYLEKGMLDLEEDINQKLRSWSVPENEFTQDEKVSLFRLLTHQSGLTRPDGGFDEDEGSIPTILQVLKGEAPAINQAAFVEYVPGARHQYSNMGFIVIQLLLEDISNKPFDQIVKETVFGPVGMKNSTVVHPLSAEFKSNLALPHDGAGTFYDRPQNPHSLGHGALVTTPADLAHFTIELMNAYQGKSSLLFSKKTAEKMLATQLELDPLQYFGFTGQGMGIFIVDVGDNFYFAQPGHNAPGTTCMLIASPSTGKGAIVMTNGEKGLLLSLEILAALINEYEWPTI
jgi:CubicO group peptidase (beta-lactamase class C family)